MKKAIKTVCVAGGALFGLSVPVEPKTASQRPYCGLSERVWAGISFSRCGKSPSPR